MSTATMEEEIVGVSVRLNQTIRQQSPKHRHSNFQRPGQMLQDWVIVCWLDMAVDWYQ